MVVTRPQQQRRAGVELLAQTAGADLCILGTLHCHHMSIYALAFVI